METKALAASDNKSALKSFSFSRRTAEPNDVVIDIDYCGICHSDLHQVRNEWGGSIYPMVPGHEIVGRVASVGASVTGFKAGDRVGVGCFVDSCRKCESCRAGEEQFCEVGMTQTYNSRDKSGATTFGGYSTRIVVDANYVLKVPANLAPEAVAPLLCAGITTYSPLKHWGATKGTKVGVVGLGGLGHMAVKLAAAMGSEVTVFSSSAKKEADAKRLGAHHYVVTSPATLQKHANHFDLILDTVSAEHDLNSELAMLRTNGSVVLVGAPEKPTLVSAFSVIVGRRRLAGSLIGGIKETQEMLDFCGAKNIVADVEVIAASDVDAAFERLLSGDVRYRFVIDNKTLA